MEALRIQAAALVAQQSALFDRELRVQDRDSALANDRARFAAERERLIENFARQTGRIELDKRRLKDAWARLIAERKEWHERRAAERADLNRRLRDLARRDKVVRTVEGKVEAERADHERQVTERRHEIEHLETRIGHARQRLLDAQSELIVSRPPDAPAIVPVT